MTTEELLKAYAEGKRDFRSADLHGANLRGAYLGSANLRGAYLRGAYLGSADLWGADLGGANLRDANLGHANLRDANLGHANLRGANLRGADLWGADLGGANLGGANLRGAYLGDQWIIQGPARSDGWFFFLTSYKGEGVRIKAGCRNFTIAEARTHWQSTRANTPLGDETFAIIDHMIALAKIRGYDVGSE